MVVMVGEGGEGGKEASFLHSATCVTDKSFPVLEVSFARSEHDVLESEGPVQTCLQMNCEAAKSVTVTLSAQESEMTQARGKYFFSQLTMSRVTYESFLTRC